jgi:acetamidase/formamidase
MEYERVPRTNSYVKDFKPMEIGVMHLRKGQGELVLKAAEMPGDQVMDFRLLLFERLNSPEML